MDAIPERDPEHFAVAVKRMKAPLAERKKNSLLQ
jgi:hypothetical protein